MSNRKVTVQRRKTYLRRFFCFRRRIFLLGTFSPRAVRARFRLPNNPKTPLINFCEKWDRLVLGYPKNENEDKKKNPTSGFKHASACKRLHVCFCLRHTHNAYARCIWLKLHLLLILWVMFFTRMDLDLGFRTQRSLISLSLCCFCTDRVCSVRYCTWGSIPPNLLGLVGNQDIFSSVFSSSFLISLL